MYAYEINNPVMMVDPNGTSWKSFWDNVGKTISYGWGYIDKILPNTYSIGVNYSIYLPLFIEFGSWISIGVGGSYQISFDLKGNVA